MQVFDLSTDYIELCQLLKASGAMESGGAAKQAIGEGKVTVDGVVELRKKCKIRPGQVVEMGAFSVKVSG